MQKSCSKQIVRFVLTFFILTFFTSTLLSAQSHTSVDIMDNQALYQLLESAELRGLLPIIKQTKPYPLSLVVDNLNKLEKQTEALSDSEQAVLATYLDLYTPEEGFTFSALVQSDNNFNLSDMEHPHSINSAGAIFGSDIFDWLSLNIMFSMMLDRTNEDAFLPYSFIKTWDHHHMDVEDRTDKSTEEFAISNRSYEEIAVVSDNLQNYVRLGRFRRDWGPGENSLLLSGTARPFLGFDTGFELGSMAYFSSTTGTLGHTVSSGTDSEQKMISAHRLDVTPFPWLTLSVWESVIFGKRMELGYLSPISIYMISQMGVAGDKDNATMGFDFDARWFPYGRAYGSLFIDEIEHDKMDQLFTYVKNIFAYYVGVEVPVPLLPFGLASFQYTKLEPYVYTHYAQSYDKITDSSGTVIGYSTPININYTNDGVSLGYPLDPNSDEFKLSFSFLPTSEIGLDFEMNYIRHGDNPDAAEDDYLITGDIDQDLNYGHTADYPEKDFLNDGIYEKIFKISSIITYSFTNIPLKLSAGYGFSYSVNAENIEGNTEFRNIIVLGGSYSPRIL